MCLIELGNLNRGQEGFGVSVPALIKEQRECLVWEAKLPARLLWEDGELRASSQQKSWG